MFAGKSSLRAAETNLAPPVNKALEDYLAKYTSDGDAANKKRKKRKPKASPAGVRILDEDLSGFAAPAAAPDPDEEDERGLPAFLAALSFICCMLDVHCCMDKSAACDLFHTHVR
jgi:hypothetical protein